MYATLHEATWHGAWLYTERAETAAVSRGNSHVTTKERCKFTTWVHIQKRITREKSAVSLLKSGEKRCYI